MASGMKITAPSVEAFQPNLMEILGQKALLGGTGIGSSFTRSMAPIKYGHDAEALRAAYGGALNGANDRALQGLQQELMAGLETEKLKGAVELIKADPANVNANLGTINNRGLARTDSPIDAIAKLFTGLAANKSIGSTYKDMGAGADSMAEAGLKPQLSSINPILEGMGAPQSQNSVPTSVQAAGAGNPTQDITKTSFQDGPKQIEMTTRTPAGNTATRQATATSQDAAITQTTGQGQVLSKAEHQLALRTLKSKYPNASAITVDPARKVSSDGKQFIEAMIDGQRKRILIDNGGK